MATNVRDPKSLSNFVVLAETVRSTGNGITPYVSGVEPTVGAIPYLAANRLGTLPTAVVVGQATGVVVETRPENGLYTLATEGIAVGKVKLAEVIEVDELVYGDATTGLLTATAPGAGVAPIGKALDNIVAPIATVNYYIRVKLNS
ncbi:MAG: DUF2190 family protein [Lactobacillus panisapium]